MSFLTDINLYVAMWLVLIVVLVVVELATVGLITIWFAAGGIAALLFAMIGCPFPVQLLVFLVVSILLLILTRPFARRYVNGKAPKTNADRVIGARAIVTEAVSNLNQTGRAVVLGQDWSIRTERDTDLIPVGTLVEVIRISGAKLIVKTIEEE